MLVYISYFYIFVSIDIMLFKPLNYVKRLDATVSYHIFFVNGVGPGEAASREPRLDLEIVTSLGTKFALPRSFFLDSHSEHIVLQISPGASSAAMPARLDPNATSVNAEVVKASVIH